MKDVRSTLDLITLAGEDLKHMGFVKRHVSKNPNQCTVYYSIPGRQELLRVSDHGAGGPGVQMNGMYRIAGLTFADKSFTAETLGGRLRISQAKYESMLCSAVGRYYLALSRQPGSQAINQRISPADEMHHVTPAPEHHRESLPPVNLL